MPKLFFNSQPKKPPVEIEKRAKIESEKKILQKFRDYLTTERIEYKRRSLLHQKVANDRAEKDNYVASIIARDIALLYLKEIGEKATPAKTKNVYEDIFLYYKFKKDLKNRLGKGEIIFSGDPNWLEEEFQIFKKRELNKKKFFESRTRNK